MRPFDLSDFHQISSLLRPLLTSRFPGLHLCKILVQINETSPVKVRTLSLHLSAIYTPHDASSYWTLTSFAVLSSRVASYMISVRQTGGLPRASFRFHITMDTLAVGYVLTATRSHSGLAPVRVRPCWANKNSEYLSLWYSLINYIYSFLFID